MVGLEGVEYVIIFIVITMGIFISLYENKNNIKNYAIATLLYSIILISIYFITYNTNNFGLILFGIAGVDVIGVFSVLTKGNSPTGYIFSIATISTIFEWLVIYLSDLARYNSMTQHVDGAPYFMASALLLFILPVILIINIIILGIIKRKKAKEIV